MGKTALGVAWAKKHGAEILYADAPCIFRGMDIGTAKPTPLEREGVAHHGIDWADLTERFSVGDYAARAREVVSEVFGRGKSLLILGGSGFYLQSFFSPPTDEIGTDPAVASKVEALYERGGLPVVVAELKRLFPEDELLGLDLQNPRRVLKALERVLTAGRSYSELKLAYEQLEPPYPGFEKSVIALERSDEDLADRIARRARAMLEGGLIDEVRGLRRQGLAENPQAACIIGYRETLAYLDGEIASAEALCAEIIRSTIALVRKQRKFFKRLPVNRVIHLEPKETFEEF